MLEKSHTETYSVDFVQLKGLLTLKNHTRAMRGSDIAPLLAPTGPKLLQWATQMMQPRMLINGVLQKPYHTSPLLIAVWQGYCDRYRIRQIAKACEEGEMR